MNSFLKKTHFYVVLMYPCINSNVKLRDTNREADPKENATARNLDVQILLSAALLCWHLS